MPGRSVAADFGRSRMGQFVGHDLPCLIAMMAVTIIAPGVLAELSPQVPFAGRKVHTGRPKFGIGEPFSADGFVSPLGRALSLTVARSEVKDASSRGEALWASTCGADLSPSVSNRGQGRCRSDRAGGE